MPRQLEITSHKSRFNFNRSFELGKQSFLSAMGVRDNVHSRTRTEFPTGTDIFLPGSWVLHICFVGTHDMPLECRLYALQALVIFLRHTDDMPHGY